MLYKKLIRPIFFLLNPEFAHKLVVATLKVAFTIPGVRFLCLKMFTVSHPSLQREVFGYHFSNPVGLAAGFDKNADYFPELACFGFSFIEVGTVTPKPQPGNPKPRLFRLIADNALVNRMGFNNKGIDYVKLNLSRKRRPKNLIIGGNIGKNTLTPNQNAIDDYLTVFHGLYPHVDYIVVNVSCPNVANLRDLQDDDSLKKLLKAITAERKNYDFYKPILLKVSPDLTNEHLTATIKIAEEEGIDGYIATNTTTSRDNLQTPEAKVRTIGNGGLSGKPLAKRSTEVIKLIHTLTQGAKPIIGVGGIHSPNDAIEKLKAGATLIQIYTGFIYEGPAIVKRINKALINIDIA
ncbi:quinone-dependent dihydroorotate dehydrogenase [Tenuifilum sp.]|uniref:quinone-dependent dihydroorotate dehydrogenase n=1 Tax=Tenuifilum sp. TaxID=2760880 RepID=UPI002BEC54EB|nr:quinone-dependent dihydroorotate dehydrogenase [Tenuifilum sp.]